MKVLLLSGLGPVTAVASSFWESEALADTFFDDKATVAPNHAGLGRRLSTTDFFYRTGDATVPLFRPRLKGEPHLTSETLEAILEAAGRDFELFRLENVWREEAEPAMSNPDVVALSTTFIYNRRALSTALRWIESRFPAATLVVGGQYSNIKYMRLMHEYPQIDYIVRGDAEVAFPMLLDALEHKADLAKVPNLVIGGKGGGPLRSTKLNEFEYIDIDAYPSPRFRGQRAVVPYESMRGCPFTCKFCSFPFASPKWRYKSAAKICRDWASYAEINGSALIRAMDSTFTVPHTRMRELFEQLPALGVEWEAYTRANVIATREYVERLEATNCRTLSIGFESMSEASLKRMDKKVKATDNRRAIELLTGSKVDFRGSFMIGYPGETTDDFAETRKFLVEEYNHHLFLSVFSMTDETMPVWDQADLYQLHVADPENPDSGWSHVGMDVFTARRLHQETLKEVRWKNDRAVTVMWQIQYQPLMPEHSHANNYRVEKLLERLAFGPKDFADDPARVRAMSASYVRELEELGVFLAPEQHAAAAG